MSYQKIAIATGLMLSMLVAGEGLAASQNPRSANEAISSAEQVAQVTVPVGTFQNSNWYVWLGIENDTYVYYASDKSSNDDLELYGAYISGSLERRICTWYNGNYEYQVAWRPSDPTVIRLQVFAPNGEELLNQLLYSEWDI